MGHLDEAKKEFENETKCPKCDFSLTSEDIKNGKCCNCFLNLLEWAKNTVETPTTKPEALKKLKEAKEHLELELITQDDYDKLKNELSPIIMSSSDDESETNQPESTPTNQKTVQGDESVRRFIASQQSQQKPSESKKRSKWVYIGIVVFILWLIGTLMPPNLKCENCGIVMEPNQTAYNTHATTSTAGELSKAGYHDKLCSTRCLGEWAKKYPSVKDRW